MLINLSVTPAGVSGDFSVTSSITTPLIGVTARDTSTGSGASNTATVDDFACGGL